jgi:hypothetical protein
MGEARCRSRDARRQARPTDSRMPRDKGQGFHDAERKSSPKVAGGKVSLRGELAITPKHGLGQGRDLRCSDLFSCAVCPQALSPFPSRAKPPAAVDRSARELRINARCAVMRNSRALRLRLAPDGGFDQNKNIARQPSGDVSVRGTVLVHRNQPCKHQPHFVLHKRHITA